MQSDKSVLVEGDKLHFANVSETISMLHGRGILPNSICLSIVHEVLKAFQGNINSVLVTECTFAGLLTVPKDDIKYKVSVNLGGAINFNIMETNIKHQKRYR